MLPRVSGISGEEYLGAFEALGYRICLLNRDTGQPDPPDHGGAAARGVGRPVTD